jgi:hypothetical protein
MEPERNTPPELLEIQNALIDREPIFHRPEHGTSRAAFAAMMADDYWEVGASGRRYGKQYILDVLDERQARDEGPGHWTTEDFYCQQIAADNYLLTYTLRQGARVTRRATLWRRAANAWLIVYHQGTIVEQPG